MQDIFIAGVDGLKGFPEAIETVFLKTAVQLCIIHMVHHSLNYVRWKLRDQVAADLKRIYQSAAAEEGETRLSEFDKSGTRATYRSPNPGGVTGRASFRIFDTRRRSEERFTPPTPSNP